MNGKAIAVGILLAAFCQSYSLATESPEKEQPLYGEAAANAVEQIKKHMDTIHMHLAQIYDAQTAAMYAPRIEAALEEIKKTDISSFANEDEECLAAQFTDSFNAIVVEVERLIKQKLYHDAVLKKLFGHYMESHDEGTMPPSLMPMAEYMILTE